MPFLADVDLLRFLKALGMARTDGQLVPAPFNVVAKTANYTILPSDKIGTLFTNRGAAGAVTFTLPGATAVPAGTWYLVLGIAGQNMSVVTATVDTLVVLNDAAADSLTVSTAGQLIGSLMLVINDGTAWIAVGIGVGATYTVAT
jgi:hypothetical protein